MDSLSVQSDYMNLLYAGIIEDYLGSDSAYKTTNRLGESAREVTNFSFQLNNLTNCFATVRNLSRRYLEGELDFYLGGSPFLKDIEKYSKFWSNVSDDGRTINSNYGKLILHDRNQHNYTQFEYAYACLVHNKDSKKAVMTVYRDQNAYKSNDNPCTMYLHFMIRDGQLNLYTKMRSNDMWFGVPYDVPFFVLVQIIMLEKLRPMYSDIIPGFYNHQVGSLHLYDRNREKVEWYLKNYSNEDLREDQSEMFKEIILRRVHKWIEKTEDL